MGNNCNTGSADFALNTPNTPHRGGNMNLGCMGCIPNPQNSHFGVDYAEILTHNQEMIPMGKISVSSIAFLQKEEIGFLKACAGKNVSALRYYTKNGANVNLLDEDRTSALHVACRSGSIQVVEELVNLGATVNMADMAGWTALHVAAYYQRPLICHVLLKNGGDPYLASRQGETPWDFVKDKATEEVFFTHLDRTGVRKMNNMINTHRKDDIPVEINDENALSPLQKPKEHTFRTKYDLEARDSLQNRDGSPDFDRKGGTAQKALGSNTVRNSTAVSSSRRIHNMYNNNDMLYQEMLNGNNEDIENMKNNNNFPKKHKYFLYFKRIKAQHMATFQENKDALRTLNSQESDEEKEDSMFDYSMGNEFGYSPSQNKSSAKLGDLGLEDLKAVKSNSYMVERKVDSFHNVSRIQSPDKKTAKGLPPTIPGRTQQRQQTHLLHPSLNHPSINNSFTKVSSMSRIDRTNLSIIPLNNPTLSVYRLFYKDPRDLAITKIDGDNATSEGVTITDMAQFNIEDKYSDLIYKVGLELFNYDGLMGIAFQLLFKFLRPSIKDIACFLFVEETRVSIRRSLQEVTNFLTNNQLKESLQILKSYSHFFYFENMSFVEALRLYLSNFVIENDPEKIDWLLRGFAKRFFKTTRRSDRSPNMASKKPIFETVETVRMLAFTTVMLDIELNHADEKGPRSKSQISTIKKEFNNNLMGINDGENFPQEFVNSVFDEVKANKLVTHMGYEGNSKAKLFFKSAKLVVKVHRNSKKKKGLKKDYLMYFVGPICFMIKFLGDTSLPKGVFMLDSCNLSPGKSNEIKFVPLKVKTPNTLQFARFNGNGMVMISSKQELSFTLMNENDLLRIQTHMNGLVC